MATGKKVAISQAIGVMAILSLFLACDYPLINQVPSTPVISEVTVGDGEVLVKWIALEEKIEKYRIYYGAGTLSRSFDFVSTTDDTIFSKKITGLINGIEYYFAAAAVIGNEESPLSESKIAIPGDFTPQDRVADPPASVEVVLGVSEVFVSWRAPADTGIVNGAPGSIIHYKIYASRTPIDPAKNIPVIVSKDDFSGKLTGLNDGDKYYIAVAAENKTGDSDLSTVREAIPTATPADRVPGKSALTRITAYDGGISIEWEAPIDEGISGGALGSITLYKVYASQGSINPLTDTAMATLTRTARSVSISNLQNGITYNFAITAVNGVGEGPLSRVLPATPFSLENRTPDRPTIIRTIIGNGQIMVIWEAPTDTGLFKGTAGTILSYKIYVSEIFASPILNAPALRTIDGTVRDATIVGLTNGTSYSVSVVAENTTGDSSLSIPEFVTPSDGIPTNRVPGKPSITAITAPVIGEVTLNWNPPIDTGIVGGIGTVGTITGYKVYAVPLDLTKDSPQDWSVSAGTTPPTFTTRVQGGNNL